MLALFFLSSFFNRFRFPAQLACSQFLPGTRYTEVWEVLRSATL